MSCWCDGEDPGCAVCHPSLDDRQRLAVRATKRAREKLLEVATMGDVADDLVEAARCYRLALADEYDAFTPYVPAKF
jgi:hypothetical protein